MKCDPKIIIHAYSNELGLILSYYMITVITINQEHESRHGRNIFY